MLAIVSKTLCSSVSQILPKSHWITSALLVCCIPAMGPAQSSEDSDSNPREQIEGSVLVRGDNDPVQSPTQKFNADGSARVDVTPTHGFRKSTFTAQPLPSAPQIPSKFGPDPPNTILVPQDPTEDTFTKPFVNELRGESIATPVAEAPKTETEALGTFATTNQLIQDQQLNPIGFRPRTNILPGEANRSFSQPIVSDPLGDRVQPTPTGSSFGSPSSSGHSAMRGFTRLNSNQPAQWMEETAGQSQFSRAVVSQPPETALPPIRSNNTIQNAYNVESADPRINQRSVVQPTGFDQLLGASKAGTALARSIIVRYTIDNFSGPLPGEPVKLVDMLRQPIAIDQRKPMILQYWATYYDWAMLVNEQQNIQWLNRIPAPGSVAEKAMLDVAHASARNRFLAAKIQLGKSQSRLVQYLPNWNSDRLPIPSDLPLIQKYKTNYEIYKSYQLIPVNLRGIDQMLPNTLELIANRAETVQLANNAANDVLDALSARRATMTHAMAMAMVRECRFQNKDLVASVVNYNQAIADYSLTVARGYQTPEQIVAMLIAKPKMAPNNVAQNLMDATAQQQRLNAIASGTSLDRQAQNVSSPNVTGQPTLIGSRPGQLSPNSGQTSENSGGFDLNAHRAFQGTGQGQDLSSRHGQSVLGDRVAPATPVGQDSFGGGSNPSGGAFGPQLPNQPTQQPSTLGNGIRSAQSPFGPGISPGR